MGISIYHFVLSISISKSHGYSHDAHKKSQYSWSLDQSGFSGIVGMYPTQGCHHMDNPMKSDPYVCHIWFAISHQYTPVMLASIYHTYGSVMGNEIRLENHGKSL